MDENERKAHEYIAQALKQHKSGIFSFLSRNSDRTDEMVSLYEKAANCYKMAQKWNEAGDAFLEAARLSLQRKSQHDAAAYYVSAASVFKKMDPQKSVQCLTHAIEIFTELGRFTIAARHHMSIAEIYDTVLGDTEQAIRHYEKAAEYYGGEDSVSSAMKCHLMVANLAGQAGQYEKAASLYEECGKTCMANKLLKYGAKDHLFKATLCNLCVDIINGNKALKSYKESFPLFEDSRECTLLQKLCDALEHQDVKEFTAAVKEYDSISRLDAWTTSVMLKLKKSINEDEEEDIT